MGGIFFDGDGGEGSTESSEGVRQPRPGPVLAADQLRDLASRLVRIAGNLEEVTAGAVLAPPSDETSEFLTLREIEREEPLLAYLAERIYDGRRRRNRFLDDDLFGEPAWDMLLDLFINHARKQRVPTTSLCIASQAPTTTALRWISILEQRGLVRRISSERDQRVHYVELEEKGYRAVSGFLRAVVRK